MRVRDDHTRESGFAMLVVFLVAAFVAISLYMELPRVVMESQRSKEQLLIDRGEQYKRAIQIYYRTLRRYPPDLDALENTNNKRFLRKRYKDPMTGEDNWRLIHAGPGGVFTDSLLTQPTGQTTQTAGSSTGDTDTTQQAPAPWLQARPSDRIVGVSPGQETPAGVAPGEELPGVAADMGSAQNPQQSPGQAGGPQPVIVQPYLAPVQSAATPETSLGSEQGQQAPAGLAGVLAPVGIGQNQPAVSQTGPGPGDQSSATGPVGTNPSNPAAGIINRLLTTPATGAVLGVQQAATTQQQVGGGAMTGGLTTGSVSSYSVPQGTTSPQQQIGGGGIAGVASQLEAEGIKVYNDRTKYNEWEFTYNPRLDPLAASLTAPGGQPNRGAPGVTLPGGTQPGGGGTSSGGPGDTGPGRRGGGTGPGGPGTGFPGGFGGFPPGTGPGGRGPGR